MLWLVVRVTRGAEPSVRVAVEQAVSRFPDVLGKVLACGRPGLLLVQVVGPTGRPQLEAIRGVPGVVEVVGEGPPLLLNEKRAQHLLDLSGANGESLRSGQRVQIVLGPFDGYPAVVDEVLPEKGLVRVLVTMFGRPAPIELEEWQIGKAEEV